MRIFILIFFISLNAQAQTYDPATTAPPPTPGPMVEVPAEVSVGEPAPVSTPAPDPAVKEKQSPAPASVVEVPPPGKPAMKMKKADTNGLRSTKVGCELREEPDGKKVGTLRAEKQVWTDDYNEGWFKVYRQTGTAFAKKSCF